MTAQQTDYDLMTPQEQRRAGRKAAWFWGGLVVTFLTAQVAVGVVAITLATGDPSVAVVPDYYQQALRWDEQQAVQQASDSLRWAHRIVVPEVADPQGRRTVTVMLADSQGAPLESLEGQVRLYHHARAGEIQSLELESLGGGNYRVLAMMDRPGLWEIELDLRDQQAAHFLIKQTVKVTAADGNSAGVTS